MRLVSLNIYGGIYLEKSLEKLKEITPDVLCLQELHEADISVLQKELDMPFCHFVPSIRVIKDDKYGFRDGLIGIGILSRTPQHHVQVGYYRTPTEGNEVPIFNSHGDNNNCFRALLSAELETAEGSVRVSTTHFTWTPDGRPNPEQWEDANKLTELMQQQNIDVLCGDFNAPNGSEIMLHIGQAMDAHMPEKVETTIDPDLHRVKGLKIVVDNVLTRKGMSGPVSLELKSGVSDHLALIAQFFKENLPNHVAQEQEQGPELS